MFLHLIYTSNISPLLSRASFSSLVSHLTLLQRPFLEFSLLNVNKKQADLQLCQSPHRTPGLYGVKVFLSILVGKRVKFTVSVSQTEALLPCSRQDLENTFSFYAVLFAFYLDHRPDTVKDISVRFYSLVKITPKHVNCPVQRNTDRLILFKAEQHIMIIKFILTLLFHIKVQCCHLICFRIFSNSIKSTVY